MNLRSVTVTRAIFMVISLPNQTMFVINPTQIFLKPFKIQAQTSLHFPYASGLSFLFLTFLFSTGLCGLNLTLASPF
jgi:hypothetical protein